ncbi:nucleoside-binding protein [Melghiribacillus thermohalophilus]|uniref:Nucleoside-binding protein n=1 Tax=Melghiribacillus thermohalophilus TaxID=1324956 RepID=A0A4R3N091_9BACI|nr:nucleoside-binding protein [Melghiribacillus thermohalophilus]
MGVLKLKQLTAFLFIFFIAAGCSGLQMEDNKQNVGMLVESTINDMTWGQKGYMGLLLIKDQLNKDVFFEENVRSQLDVNQQVQSFAEKHVGLIFGHGSIYGRYFLDIHKAYPDTHFVYFNGNQYGSNMTSLNFDSHPMGFFAGMTAAEMSETGHVGVIAAHEWQPEVGGFYEGAKYVDPDIQVHFQYVYDWNDENRALELYDIMKEQQVDVFYPAGDGYSVPVIEKIKEDGLYAIGFVTDQYELAPEAVLTSTVQHVDRLYLLAAQMYQDGNLPAGILSFGFQDGVISMGTYSEEIPEMTKRKIEDAVNDYIETGRLPNE